MIGGFRALRRVLYIYFAFLNNLSALSYSFTSSQIPNVIHSESLR